MSLKPLLRKEAIDTIYCVLYDNALLYNHELEVYRVGIPETSTFAGGLEFVSRVSTDGMLRVVDRLNLEGQGTPVRTVPVGGREGAGDLFGLFDKARQGFRLLFKMHSDKSDGIDPAKFMKGVGISAEDEAARFINGSFPSRGMTKPNDGFSLSVTLAFTTTLRKLAQAETVNFYYLGIIPADDDTHLILHPSYWNYNITPETVWDTVLDIEANVRKAVLQRGFVENPDSLYKAAHFLGAISSLRGV